MERVVIPNDKDLEIFTISNFLTSDECDNLVNLTETTNFYRSTVAIDDSNTSTYHNGRTSSTSFLSDHDNMVDLINKRMHDELGIPLGYSEPAQAQIYEVGQEYKHHYDYFTGSSYNRYCSYSGQRTWTFMLYLNDVEEGGETDFSEIGVRFKPIKGTAVVWKNSNGKGTEKSSALHAGMPIIKGKKIIITKWFRENLYNSTKDAELAIKEMQLHAKIETNLVKKCVYGGAIITPLIVPYQETNGLGLMNPSVFVEENGNIIINLRNVNYTFYHSEKKLFQHPYGPLTYIHPENDERLRTWNWYIELDNNLSIKKYTKIDTSKFDTYEPLWDFVGLEDARIFRWDNKLYLSGVRRDTTTNGEGRMELSEIKITDNEAHEISRVRILPPIDHSSYCEKNWMPIIDKPYHYIKWSNPTEVVKVDPLTGKSITLTMSNPISLPRDLRGGSQVIPFEDGYIAITHEVDLFNSEAGRKDAVYWHRIIKWDKYFNIVKYSKEFHFMDGHVEFCVGLSELNDNFLITFGFQDNAAFLLSTPKYIIKDFLYENN
jgi:prolyl 4-hydroxylase